jgi:hypothetical protein
MSNVAPLIGGLALVVVPCAAVIWMGIQHWRGGPDRPWSARLRGLARASAGGLFLGLFVLVVVDKGQWPPVVVYSVMLAFLACLAMFAAAKISAVEEARRTRRIDIALGLPVPRRLAPPALIGVLWLLIAVGGLCALILGAAAVLEHQLRTHAITLADANALTDDVVVAAVVWGPFCLIVGGAHVWYQGARRRREALAVHRARLELPGDAGTGAGRSAGHGGYARPDGDERDGRPGGASETGG